MEGAFKFQWQVSERYALIIIANCKWQVASFGTALAIINKVAVVRSFTSLFALANREGDRLLSSCFHNKFLSERYILFLI